MPAGRRAGLIAVAVAAVAAAIAVASTSSDGPAAVGPTTASAVSVRASGCRRTFTRSVALAVGPDLLLTVAHAVAGETVIEVTTPDGRVLPASLAAVDPGLDGAVLRVAGLGLPPLALDSYRSGIPVELLTMPETRPGLEPAEVQRLVSVKTSDIYGGKPVVRPGIELVRSTVEAGDSGGGVIQGGRLVGVVWATSRETDGRAWATQVSAFEHLIESARDGSPVAELPCSR